MAETKAEQAPNTTQQEQKNAASTTNQGEEQKSFAERMATMERPNVDNRVKTEDVTATSGMTFRDFNLADSVQFVSSTSMCLLTSPGESF